MAGTIAIVSHAAALPPTPTAEQIMAMPAEVQRRWTAREVRDLIAASPLATPRYELVDGELLVTPSPAFPHQLVVGRLLFALTEYLDRQRLGTVVGSPSDVELEPEFISQPDIFVVPKNESRRVMAEGLPVRELLLAVEVLSPSSSRHDRVRKRPLYQRHVPVYWIVDVDARLFERWATSDERPELVTETLSWHPPGATTAFTLDLRSFFESVFATD
jgi:Uma2 family endonuclease